MGAVAEQDEEAAAATSVVAGMVKDKVAPGAAKWDPEASATLRCFAPTVSNAVNSLARWPMSSLKPVGDPYFAENDIAAEAAKKDPEALATSPCLDSTGCKESSPVACSLARWPMSVSAMTVGAGESSLSS